MQLADQLAGQQRGSVAVAGVAAALVARLAPGSRWVAAMAHQRQASARPGASAPPGCARRARVIGAAPA